MIVDFLSWYAESVSAFWESFARGGGMRWVLFSLLIWWLMCRRHRCRRHRCGHHHHCHACGCRCGRCPCGEVGPDKDDGEASTDSD